MKKLIIDCSKPVGHPERETIADVPEQEAAAMIAAFQAEQAEAAEPVEE